MTRYAVALGSNLGDRVGQLRSAVGEIRLLGQVLGVSGLYETEPIGGVAQDPYLNAVVVVESSLPPASLLAELHSIEAGHEREREFRWGPRTLDLDIVTMDEGEFDTPAVRIPHPGAWERRFVLEPLCDVWPEAMVRPGLSAAEAREGVTGQEVDLLARKWGETQAPRPGRYWVLAQVILFLAIAAAMALDGSFPGAEPEGRRVVGGVVLVLGALAAAVSAWRLGGSLTPMPEPRQGGSLVEAGLYARVRHPIYGGVFLMMLGTSFLLDSLVAVLLSLALLAFFWAKSGYEERQLRIAYPGYAAYRRRVPRRMIPYVL
jgi:2-amino-4-hydroxy-6-hydroxymethyldihydropteridine diphosphokinase